MKANGKPERTDTGINAEASASMPFGANVAFKTSATTDKDSVLPAATTAKLKGFVAFGNDYARTFTTLSGTTVGELDTVGLKPGTFFMVIEAGEYWVVCEDGCAAGDRLFVRISGGTLGAARASDAGGSSCIDATSCGKWLTPASAGAVAKLQFDFLPKTTAGAA